MEKITLYHGSNQKFNEIDLSKSKDKRDFGKGFYMTTVEEQAINWAENMFLRYGGDGQYVYEYQLDLSDSLKVFTYDDEMALKKLAFFRVNDQVSVHTEKGLSHVRFVRRISHGK